jgi:glycosyltransferase involved in cell wall biosynthesis
MKGGLSGSDAIYEAFKENWDASIRVQNMMDIDYKPFAICYIHRILLGCLIALFEPQRFDFVYSASDFWMDSLPGFIHKLKGEKWVAGYYLHAFKSSFVHYHTQKLTRWLIRKFADMVIVTNPTMYSIFPNKKKTWINGVIDLQAAGLGNGDKVYDAVFCGRIHPTKGIDELIDIWDLVRQKKPHAQLALIGDGDLGKDYVSKKLQARYGINRWNGVNLLGYMGKERYQVFKKSKVFLYPTPKKYDHFSIAPVEAMACGTPVIVYDTPVMRFFEKELGFQGGAACPNNFNFAEMIISFINGEWKEHSLEAQEWAQQFDEERQANRVFNDIKKELFDEDISDGPQRDGGDIDQDGFTGTRLMFA